MLKKLIYLFQVTFTLKQVKIKKVKPVRKLVCSNQEKVRRGFKGFSRDNVVRNQSLRLRKLFRTILCIIDFCGNTTFEGSALFTLVLLLLKKLLLISIFIICKLMDDLLDKVMNGNWNLTILFNIHGILISLYY